MNRSTKSDLTGFGMLPDVECCHSCQLPTSPKMTKLFAGELCNICFGVGKCFVVLCIIILRNLMDDWLN